MVVDKIGGECRSVNEQSDLGRVETHLDSTIGPPQCQKLFESFVIQPEVRL